MSPTAAMNVVAVIRLTPGTVISRLIASEPSACSAIAALEDRDLAVEEVDLAQAPVDGLALVGGQLELGQPRAAAAPERVAHRRAALERAHQHRVDLVLGSACAGAPAARGAPGAGAAPASAHPAASSRAAARRRAAAPACARRDGRS